MRVGKGIIAFLTAAMAALAVLGMTQEEMAETHQIPLEFSVQTEAGSERLTCWKNPEGEYVIFVPGYAGMEQVTAVPRQDGIMLDGQRLWQSIACSEYLWDHPYPIAYPSGKEVRETTLTFVRSGNVPSLYLDVASGSLEYLHLEKTNEESGRLRLYGPDGNLLYSGTASKVRGRGNTTWWAEKKPYNITLAQSADLLGMGAADRWILLAVGTNVTPIRNKIVYDFADKIGLPYSPDCEWVDLYLNGEYAGLYLLTERNEVHPERIDIPEEGSFLISMELEDRLEAQNLPYVKLDSTQVLRTRHSGLRDQELRQIWTMLENALRAEDGVDPTTGRNWQDLIDMDSWVRKYLIEEAFGNADGGKTSQYYFMSGSDPEKRIVAGPVWDYDYSMGGEGFWLADYPNVLLMNREYTSREIYVPWFYELYHKDAFYDRLVELYEWEFVPAMTELLAHGIDGYMDAVFPAMRSNGIRWGYSEEDIWSDTDYIKAFLRERMAFLQDLWLGDSVYHMVTVNREGYAFANMAVKDGEMLPDIRIGPEENSRGWYCAQTGEAFDMTQPIYEDVTICLGFEESPDSASDTAGKKLPAAYYLPVAAIAVLLASLIVLDRSRRKRRKTEKDFSPSH